MIKFIISRYRPKIELTRGRWDKGDQWKKWDKKDAWNEYADPYLRTQELIISLNSNYVDSISLLIKALHYEQNLCEIIWIFVFNRICDELFHYELWLVSPDENNKIYTSTGDKVLNDQIIECSIEEAPEFLKNTCSIISVHEK
jgi:hypothetical protein